MKFYAWYTPLTQKPGNERLSQALKLDSNGQRLRLSLATGRLPEETRRATLHRMRPLSLRPATGKRGNGSGSQKPLRVIAKPPVFFAGSSVPMATRVIRAWQR